MISEPLKNWRIFKEQYANLFITMQLIIENERQFKNVNTSIDKYIAEYDLKYFLQLEKLAKEEIEDLTFTHHIHPENLINNIQSELTKIEDYRDKIRRIYKSKFDKELKVNGYYIFNISIFIFQDWFQELAVRIKGEPIQQDGFDIDLSDTSASQKIIYLNELGIIDFLRTKQPFNTSINSLATALSAITGEQNTTIQPYLNAMISNLVDKKNDPYKTKKTVDKVKNQLTNIGFASKSTQ